MDRHQQYLITFNQCFRAHNEPKNASSHAAVAIQDFLLMHDCGLRHMAGESMEICLQ